jgi:hypothetical protein
MTHLKFCQFPIKVILGTSGRLQRDYHNFATPPDFDLGDAHTGCRHSLHGPGHVCLAE